MSRDQATLTVVFLSIVAGAAVVVAIVLPAIADILRDILKVLEATP